MAKIREYVTVNKNSSYYVPLKRLTYEQIRGFKEAQAVKGSNIMVARIVPLESTMSPLL